MIKCINLSKYGGCIALKLICFLLEKVFPLFIVPALEYVLVVFLIRIEVKIIIILSVSILSTPLLVLLCELLICYIKRSSVFGNKPKDKISSEDNQ